MARRTLLLVSPPVLYAASWWANRIANKPHLASLAGYVRDVADVRLLEMDLTAGAGAGDPLAELDEQMSDVALVGISCWTSLHYLGAVAVAQRVRQIAPNVPIVVGGHHATAAPEDFSRELCDWLVRGDGEAVLRGLCLEWPKRPAEMQIVSSPVFAQSNPGDVDWDNYGRPGAKERALWLSTSRGCAFKCRFCVEPQRGAAYSRYSVDDTLEIIGRLVQRYGPRVIAFSDPIFGANRRWTETFLAGLEERAFPLMYWAETRADLMSRELLDRMKRLGFMVDFGLDAASPTMVERMEKAASPARYLQRSRELLNHANAIGLHHGVYLVFNFPGETPETTREAQAFIESLGERGARSGWLSAQTFFILPGTDAFIRMGENAAAYGTEIRFPHWWKIPVDQYSLATDVLPSSAWIGREHELGAFQGWNREINASWSARYPEEVMRFRVAFYTG